MKLASVITTAPRRVSYLDETLSSLSRAGFDTPIIIDDEDKTFGPYGNFRRALRIALREFPKAEVIAVFQDDILVVDRLRAWIDANCWPVLLDQTGIVSLYCAGKHELNRSGFHRLPLKRGDSRESDQSMASVILNDLQDRGRCFPDSIWRDVESVEIVRVFDDCTIAIASVRGVDKWLWAFEWEHKGQPRIDISEMTPWSLAYGACAYLIPRVNADRFICEEDGAKTKTDINVARICSWFGLDYWMYSPSLVQHVGEVSSLDDRPLTPYRRSERFRQEAVA